MAANSGVMVFNSTRCIVMTKITRLFVCVSCFLTAPAVFACDYPAKVNIPSGVIATKEDMLQGQRDVKKYVTDMEAYLECIVAEEKIARSNMDGLQPEDEQQREDMLNKKYNAAVDEMETVAAAFNTEVQAYRNREQ